MKSYYFRTELSLDTWRVPCFIFERAKDYESLILVDPLAKKMQTILKEDFPVIEDDENYKIVWIEKIPELYIISEYETRLLLRFHYSWFNILYDYITSSEFKKTIAYTNEVRKTEEVFPSTTEIFSAFLTDFYKIKVTWLGLSPYFTKQQGRNDANGICFSTYNKQKPKSLEVLANGIKKDMQLGFSWVLQNDLLHLQNQGVFLLNSALTTTKDPLSHVKIWKPFIQYVLSKLSVPTIAFGKVAHEFEFNNKVWKVNHPSYYARNEKEPDYKCFSELNEIVKIEY
jgi:uracil DNA glycosylase